MAIPVLDENTDEILALIIIVTAVIMAAYLSYKANELVLLQEAALLVLGFYFGKKGGNK